jgi:16S rRNA (uracil1498-N3)-methyltransferase
MATPRFHCPNILAPGQIVSLPPNAAIHASKALRMQAGDKAILFNGDGNDYPCTLVHVTKSGVTAKVSMPVANNSESPIKVTLAQAISSGDRMDYTLQKAVELGVTAIQPIASQRSIVKLSGERAEKRREHWQNVVISACEQSGRAIVPDVAAPLPLAQWLAGIEDFALRLTLSPYAETVIQELPAPKGDICLLVGSEGGLTEDEITMASNKGFQAIRLGSRILRTETAPLAALAAMQTLWGDFNQ